MNLWIQTLGIAALIGSAMIGGVFFTFSSFVMKALAHIPVPEGVRAMQSINVVVLNPSFLGAFFGTTLLCAALLVLSFFHPLPVWFILGSIAYIGGTFLVTGLGNVPLNNQLAAATAENAQGLWTTYQIHWTNLNHVRTAAALLAALSFTIGLIKT